MGSSIAAILASMMNKTIGLGGNSMANISMADVLELPVDERIACREYLTNY